MELKEFFKKLNTYKFTFFLIVFSVVGLVVTYLLVQPVRYVTVLSLHVGRTHSDEQIQEYQYDDFYRLQADEKFADTLVRWLSSPSIVADIYSGVGKNISIPSEHQLPKIFKAKRLSSQYIEIRYTTSTKKIAQDLAISLEKVINQRTENLNVESKKNIAWFRVVVERPITYPYYIPWIQVLLGSLAVGIVFGLWGVGLRIHFEE